MLPRSAVAPVHLRLLPVLAALVVATSAPARENPDVQSIAALDSLTGDSTIVDGSVVYVDFWASWCVPCRGSFPWMAGLRDKYGSSGLQVLTVNLDRDAVAARKFLRQTGTSLPVVYDPDGKLAKLYDLQAMPSSFVYGRDGTLRTSLQGFSPEETGSVESLIVKLLEEEHAP
jgi:thiol-disulfide isomerase/thioredoxin